MVDFKALAAPFDPGEVSWRLGSVSKAKMQGMALAYLDARNIMERLDAVCGPAGWQAHYPHAGQKTVCSISILCGDVWVAKANGAGDSDIEAEKGALSDALKRAGVMWGIGRYLYDLKSPWVQVEEIGTTGKFKIAAGAYKELDMVLRRATQALLSGAPPQVDGLSQAKNDIAAAQNAGQQPITQLKSAGRLAAEAWADGIIKSFKAHGFDMMAFRDWKEEPSTPKGTKTNDDKLAELREKHPDLGQKIDDAADALRLAAA